MCPNFLRDVWTSNGGLASTTELNAINKEFLHIFFSQAVVVATFISVCGGYSTLPHNTA